MTVEGDEALPTVTSRRGLGIYRRGWDESRPPNTLSILGWSVSRNSIDGRSIKLTREMGRTSTRYRGRKGMISEGKILRLDDGAPRVDGNRVGILEEGAEVGLSGGA